MGYNLATQQQYQQTENPKKPPLFHCSQETTSVFQDLMKIVICKNLELSKQTRKIIIVWSFCTKAYWNDSLIYSPSYRRWDSPLMRYQLDTLPWDSNLGEYVSYTYLQNICDGKKELCFGSLKLNGSGGRICLQCWRPGFSPWFGRPPGEQNGNPLQYSSLDNSMDRGVWQATAHRVAQRWT